ncbi:MAG: Na(+)-translocating NADH-quinone reductase subunit A [Gemmatimonadetes bacterium]|nr:Na(+)-translocating NADH-quinone reductase subunit A [Gemmatimonadota bacterium]
MPKTAYSVRRGLDLPLSGAPVQEVSPGPELTRVAFIADDFHGLRPKLRVSVGQEVRRGDVFLEDGATPGVFHTSPGAGVVEAIHRGGKRTLESIVVRLSEAERHGQPRAEELRPFNPTGADVDRLDEGEVRSLLVESGLWTAFRTRPFSRVPRPDSVPDAIFVTAIDTNPLAPDPDAVLADQRDDFFLGLRGVARLSGGETFLCVAEGSDLPNGMEGPINVAEFTGPHPAGLPGLHIHKLAPVGRNRSVWTIGYQDVASIGRLMRSGHLDLERVVAIGGPPVLHPRLIRTRVGASIEDVALVEELRGGLHNRWISGSVWSGKVATSGPLAFLGRYDLQLTVLSEGGKRQFLAWLAPGVDKFSVLPAFLSRLRKRSPADLSTDMYGSRRALIPLGLYERVMPMDILPTFLLRALAAGDLERAVELGCLELDEEDLALCTFVDPSKNDFGAMLRTVLDRIQAEA